MTDYSSVSIPPPTNWQDFERHCRVLFAFIFNDPTTSLHGRPGQLQDGVDIFGRINSDNNRWFGVQCKGKERNYKGAVTETELRREVEKAHNFSPGLSEFILATTAPNDAKIQKIARKITQENTESGRPMVVHVWGWDELKNRISLYPEAIQAFHPNLTPFTGEISSGIADLKIKDENRDRKIDQVLKIVSNPNYAVRNTSDTATKASETIDIYLHGEIDNYRDLIRDGRSRTALNLLEKLKERCWKDASSRVQFRIVTNIGAAKLQLGDEKGAADDFLAAIEYDPTDKIGMANTVLAHLIKSNMAEAVKEGQAALRQDPMNADAASYLIQAHLNDDSITDPLILVPKELHDTPAVRMGVILFFRRRRQPEWRKAAREAFSLFPDVDELKRVAAEADLDEIMESRWILLGQCPPVGFGLDELHNPAIILESLWNKHKTIEGSLIDTSLPRNLTVAYRALGDHKSAGKILDEVLEKAPDDIGLVRERAAIHLVLDEEEKALKLLQEKSEKDPETAVMIAQQLMKIDSEAAREVLSNVDKSNVDEEHRLSASFIKIESYFKENKLDIVMDHANALAKAYPGKIEVLVFLAHCQNKCGDAAAEQTLTQAMELLDEASSFYDRFIIARELDRQQRDDEVVDVLDGLVDLTRDTPALRLLLPAMINSGRRRQVHDAIKKLPQDVAKKPFYLRIQSAVHMIRGDYVTAEKVMDHYLQMCPEDLSMRLKWIDVRMRRGNGTDVRAFLEGNVERLDGKPLDRIYLARWLNHFGFEERSLKLGYEVFLKNRKDPKIHLQYMGLLLFPSRAETINLEVAKVGVNVVFSIENERRECESYLIEPEEDLRTDDYAIPSDHLVARKALGLQVGDTFIIHEHKEPLEKWRIISIKHKWLDALHKSMERFERQFPMFKGFERIAIDQKATDSLQPVLARIKDRHDAIQAAFDQYEQNNLPLEFISHNFGGDLIEVWHGLQGAGRAFRVCIGTWMERNVALEAIERNECRGCVVDILTFHIIRRLGIEDAVSAICGPIGITESSVDVLRLRKEDIMSHIGNPFMTISWRDGQYFRDEITDEQLQHVLKMVDDDLDWIDQHCKILPAEGTRELPPQIRKLSGVFDRKSFDTILAADGSNRLLLCEDYAYRMIGAQEFRLESSWLQPVLMAAQKQNLLTTDRYVEATINMIDGGFRFISIDAVVLLKAASDKNDPDGRKFAKIAEMLGGSDADMVSHIRVAANFFTGIWREGDPSLQYQAQTGKILECLMRGQSKAFMTIIKKLRLLVSLRNKEFARYLSGWLKGHFSPSFNVKQSNTFK